MTVSDQIIKVLDALCEKFGIVIDWTSANVIPYITTLCTKLISYEIWTSVAWMAVMVGLSIISIVLVITFRNKLHDSINYGEGFLLFPYTGFVAIWIATILIVGFQIFDIIKCTTFPEMYVFEYVQGIINAAK
jgi:hypothetical protein